MVLGGHASVFVEMLVDLFAIILMSQVLRAKFICSGFGVLYQQTICITIRLACGAQFANTRLESLDIHMKRVLHQSNQVRSEVSGERSRNC